MKDRVPLYPGRVTITPVSGQANTYDMSRADQPTQEGTPLNKATFLKDSTAALFGLGSDAVPDDVLKILSRFQSGLGNEYLWGKQQTKDIESLINETSTSFGWAATCNYSDSVVLSDGVVTLVAPVSSTFEDAKTILQGKYFSSPTYQSGKVFKAKTVTQVGSQQTVPITFSEVVLTPTLVTVGYVNSADADAYPPSAPDGYAYTPLGQLGNKTQIETGSYVGTGTYGSSNPNTLTFGISAKLVIINKISGGVVPTQVPNYYFAIFTPFSLPETPAGNGYSYTFMPSELSPSSYANAGFSQKTLTWYFTGTNADRYQFNESGATYSYLAIG